MCHVLKVSRAGYYHYIHGKVSRRQLENKELLKEIKDIYKQSHGVYGVLRITAELRDRGRRYNKKRIQRIMRINGIRAKTKKKFKVTTDSKKTKSEIPDLVKRNFKADKINKLWASDITYVYTKEGWLYLCAVLDVCSRKIVGWAMHRRLTDELVLNAIKQAVKQRRPLAGCIFHSDRGSQYDSAKVKSYLKRHGFLQSMSKKGNCYDNAIMETFFHSLKTEKLKFEKFHTRMQAIMSIFDYIEIFYNRQRRHSALKYKTPEEFELLNTEICLN